MVAVLDTAALTGFHRGLFSVSAEDDCVYLIADAGAIPLPRTRVLTTLDDAELSPIGADWGPMLMAPASPVAVGSTQFEGRLGGLYHGESGKFFIDGAHGLIAGPVVFDMMREVLDSRITFTGDNKRTYFDSSGVMQTAATNAPRWNYRYSGGLWVKSGLLVEPAATNLIVRACEFDHASWTKAAGGGGSSPVVTANAAAAPDGTTTADLIVFDAGANGASDWSQIQGPTFTTTAQPYTFSVYLKTSDGSTKTAILSISGGGAATKTITGTWTRFDITWTASAGSFNPRIYVGGGATSASVSLHAWGAQVEAGSVATSYIATTSATVTRAADVASITGTNFSNFFNPLEGTFVAEGDCPATTTHALYTADDSTTSNVIRARSSVADLFFSVRLGAADQAALNAGAILAGVNYKIASAYKANDFAASLNGAAAVADASGSIPTVNRLVFGTDAGGNYLTGHIRELRYLPRHVGSGALPALAA